MLSETKLACGCWAEWTGERWQIAASSFLCDHKQGDPADGAPPARDHTDGLTAIRLAIGTQVNPLDKAEALTALDALVAERNRLIFLLKEGAELYGDSSKGMALSSWQEKAKRALKKLEARRIDMQADEVTS